MTGDRVTADLRAHEAEQDARQRAFDHHERDATAAVRQRALDEGLTEEEADDFLKSGAGVWAVEDEVCQLERAAEDSHTDALIDARRYNDLTK